jgi:hypothetical protein
MTSGGWAAEAWSSGSSRQVIRFLLDREFPIPSPGGAGKDRPPVRGGDRPVPLQAAHRPLQEREVNEEIARQYFKRAERDGRYGVVPIEVA